MICGNFDYQVSFFPYRSSSYLTEFFENCDLEEYVHVGSTRKWWVANVLEQILQQQSLDPTLPSSGFQTVVQVLMDKADNLNEEADRSGALTQLNNSLAREGLEAFYAEDNLCYIRNTKTGLDSRPGPIVERALSKDEVDRYKSLEKFLNSASEDEFTEKILLPLFQSLRFRRISVAGHTDKSMEYGKDIWMKYELPTGHWLYFGVQVKRGKIDAAASSKNHNVAEIHRQITMMLGHEIFDPDINKKRLIDHAIIVASGEITKQAENWLGQRLDASQRSQILFMDRPEILHLFVIHNVPMPVEKKLDALDSVTDNEIPF